MPAPGPRVLTARAAGGVGPSVAGAGGVAPPAPRGHALRRLLPGPRAAFLGLGLLLVLSIGLAVAIGPVTIPLVQVWEIVVHHVWPGAGEVAGATAAHDQIVWELRLPRVLLAACVGAGLAVVGAVLQALVRNPLADPYVFGISSGASVGATVVIVLGLSIAGAASLSVAAFLGALAAFALVMLLAGSRGTLAPSRLILAGVAVAYTMSAATSAILYVAASGQNDAGKAQQVMFWLLGGLAGASWSDVAIPAGVVVLGTLALALQARPLNALLVGEETAATLGVDLDRFRRRTFTLAALITGVMVAVSGGIGFVGLMLPHVVRAVAGADHRRVLPASALVGAVFLIWADVIARMVAAPQEIPIGVVTAIFGTPFFAVLIRARRRAGALR